MTISKDVLDELLNGVENAEDLLGDQGLVKELKVRLMERMLGAELTEHLGYEPDAKPANQQSNRRNGTSRKTLKGNDGALPIDVPRDRDGSFEPELIKKGQTRIDGMDDKIIGLYAAGLSTRDIRAHLEEVYGLKVSSRSYQPCDRRCPGGSVGLAEPRPGADVSDCFPRCSTCQNPRRGKPSGQQQGRLRGPGRHPGG